MRATLILALAVFLFSACTGDEPRSSGVGDAVTYDTLTTVRSVDVGSDLNVLGLFATDTTLIVLNRGPEQLFALYSLPDVEPLYTWGAQGEGPGELSAPVAAASINTFGNVVEVDDANRQVLRAFEIGEDELVLTDERPLPYDGRRGPLNTVTRLDSLTYVATAAPAGEEQSAFLLLDLAADESRPFGEYPETDFIGREKYQSFMKRLVASPDGSTFYAMYLNHDRVRLYDRGGEMLEERVDAGPRETTGAHRIFGHGTQHFAYMLAPLAEEEEMLAPEGYHPVLEVWDWGGSLVAAYTLAEPVHFFTVSTDDRYVYGYSYLNPEELMIFELPQ